VGATIHKSKENIEFQQQISPSLGKGQIKYKY
jgi:hypothetical protein